jgi:hypothetical protein
MAPAQSASGTRQCPRCSGLMYQDHDRDYTCMNCGECIYFAAPRLQWKDLEPPLAPGKRRRGRPRKHPVAA